MIVFLTSSPTGPLDGSRPVDGLDKMNGFVDNLRKYWKPEARCLMITAFPEDDDANDEMRGFFQAAVRKEQLSCSAFDIWDGRTEDYSEAALKSYDVVILGGGHVPTQSSFFHAIGLKGKIKNFKGIVIGISAGTMNSAAVVYAQPELPGEAVDPDYQRFIPGLGLTDTNILPHLQMVRDWEVDGLRLYEDIGFIDSLGREFLALPDGSYLLIESNGWETVYGEAYRVAEGRMEQICQEGHKYTWKSGYK